ncbi:MAG: hypothetical protein ACU837_07700 [Gammaproteobacteria bacterium]
MKIFKLLYVALSLTVGAFTLSAQAHEFRDLGDDYYIQVGGHVEPPYINVKNGIDFYPFHLDDPVKGFPDGVVGLDKLAGDTVEISAVGLIVPTDDFNVPITRLFPLNNTWKYMPSQGYYLYYQENAFSFKKPHAYGFYAQGKIKRKGFKTKRFAEKFICENGSQDTTYGTAFECVTVPAASPIDSALSIIMPLGK